MGSIESDDPTGFGEDSEGLVEAEVSVGAVERIRIEPSLLRLGPDVVAERVMAAVNDAFRDLREQAEPPDPAVFRQRRDEAQAAAATAFARLESMLDDASRRWGVR